MKTLLEWRDYAKCLEIGTEPYFADGLNPAQEKALCAGCPVAAQCLEDALTERSADQHGIRAGMNADARRNMLRRRRERKTA